MATCKRICILGNYSGRNAGDTAILAGVLREISSRYTNMEYVVPTLNPQFIRKTFGKYPITPVSLLPWHGCIKFLGLPAWKAMRSSDLILITDAILFDRGLFNPLHNYLSTLALWIPKARRHYIPVVLYNVSLGPVSTPAGRWCLNQVLRNSALLILRDDESRRILDLIAPLSIPVLKGADSALSAPACSPHDLRDILHDKGLMAKVRPRVGINVNAYADAFVRNGPSRCSQEKLLSILSRTAEWIYQELKSDVWLFGTQYMDLGILQNLQKTIRVPGKVPLFTNREHSYAQLMALFSEIELLIGMRTHSVILASSVGTPVIGIINYPKTHGYLQRIGQGKQAIPIQDLELERIQDLVRASWEQREFLRRTIRQAVEGQRQLAWRAAENLRPLLET